jgi:CheY-like chemotaxis protein
VSLRILFADDSMTAQNMGKKILTEAGYDVVAVSNGAAAVKKIAEQKPDIIILDVYMPGYSGLEVCEKVRGSLDTLKTPVLLTVGKMEPFKSEDGNRVKADGVIIKPFEATDLLAIVKKFEERIGNAPPPIVAQTVVADPVEEAAAQPEPEQHSTGSKASMQPMVEVPDHMASSSAFVDMLGGEPANSTSHFAVNTPAATFETSVIVPAPPVPTEHEVPSPAMETLEPPVVEPEQVIPEEVSAPLETVPDFISAPVEATPAPAPIEPDTQPTMAEAPTPAPVAEAAHPQFIPVFKDPEPPREPEAEYAFMPTSVAPVGDLEIPREPALQETAEETTRSTQATQVEPGLMSTIGQQVEEFPAQVMEAAVPPPPVETSTAVASAPQASYSTPAPMPVSEAATEVTDADFEARVAAAMAAYNQASEPAHNQAPAIEMEQSSAAELGHVIADHARTITVPEVPEVHAVEPQPEEPPAVSEQVPSFEYQPPVRAAESVPVASAATASAGSTYEHTALPIEAPAPPAPSPIPMNVDPAAVAASVEAAIPEAAAAVAADSGADHHTIANAIHRVMERLKPELVEEIMKELRSKK